ncbi:hypothetical protein BDU57DRAFT_533799 [Ampelomyces quisqualis]|uniref:Uncharacterized protein n=1 Tax=Ampelomyces quisqualis TaxID=50730 RepID=A0A6A5Q7W4_AMPQU|nr:hypothetical protein BDU57DRAFT_533799 [Ampelomyces quisqualis]
MPCDKEARQSKTANGRSSSLFIAMAFNMFGNNWPDGMYVRHPGRLVVMAVVVGFGSWYAYTVLSFGSSYMPDIPAARLQSGIGESDGRGLACLEEAGLGMGKIREWVDDTVELSLVFGKGDAGFERIADSVQRVARQMESIVPEAQDVRIDMADEVAEMEVAFRAAEHKLAEAHRFNKAPGGTLRLVNGTLAWVQYACSTAKNDCTWTAPFAASQSDQAIYQELIRQLIEIRKNHRRGRQLGMLHNRTSLAHSTTADARHFAVRNWDTRRLAASTCLWWLGRVQCSLRDVSEQKQPELHLGMESFFRGQRRARDHLQAVHDTLWHAKVMGHRLDTWLTKELDRGDKTEERGHGGGDTIGGWERVNEARRQARLSVSFVCAKPQHGM